MRLTEFVHHLRSASDRELRFSLPDGDLIEAHAHVTEVGRIDKSFIDCGGTVRNSSHISLQTWVADDTDHRLRPSTLAEIIRKAAPILGGGDDLEVEIEYEACVISQYPVESAAVEDGALIFRLGTKHTDCLAKELCLPKSTEEACCGGGGCC